MRIPLLHIILSISAVLSKPLGSSENDVEYDGFCNEGNSQSPINIDISNVFPIKLDPLEFHHYDVYGTVDAHNNGHTELVRGFDSWGERPYISGGGLGHKYYLQQFHFHWDMKDGKGSEHSLNGLHYPLEAHFVHIREDLNSSNAFDHSNGLAVVAVFFEVVDENASLFDLAEALNKTVGWGTEKQVPIYSPKSLLPPDTSTFFRYNGSLTTSPCSESVVWTIISSTNTVSRKQLQTLRQHLKEDGSHLLRNWRGPQPKHNRPVFLNHNRMPDVTRLARADNKSEEESDIVSTVYSDDDDDEDGVSSTLYGPLQLIFTLTALFWYSL